MMGRDRILLIDDDPALRMLASMALSDDYEVIEGESGLEGLALAKSDHPDMILLDINMPGIDGFEVCRRLKADSEISSIPVLFLSGEVGHEERLQAYEAGGEDFIAKPFDPEELQAKVAVSLRALRERQRLAAEAQSAFQTAMTAMSSVSELGTVIQTLRKSFASRNIRHLADILLEGCRSYGLDACIQLRSSAETISRNILGDSSPMEAGVLANQAESGRIFSLGRRAVFNYGQITLMIKDMPKDDPERYGRLRDDLALLAEGADARLYALDTEMAIETQRQVLEEVLATSFSALESIDSRHERQRAEAQFVLTRMLEQFENTLYSLGLTEAQEEKITSMLRDEAYKVLDIQGEGLDVGSHIAAIRSRLSKLPPIRQRTVVEVEEPASNAGAGGDGVDLF